MTDVTRPTRDFVEEALAAHPFIAPDKSCMYLDVLQREVRELREELARNAEREQRAYAMFGSREREVCAERDALKLEVAALEIHLSNANAGGEGLRVENERLRAELASVERCECNPDLTDLEDKLRELREAGEELSLAWGCSDGGAGGVENIAAAVSKLRHVLAKLEGGA